MQLGKIGRPILIGKVVKIKLQLAHHADVSAAVAIDRDDATVANRTRVRPSSRL
jgi:hypothetical protein